MMQRTITIRMLSLIKIKRIMTETASRIKMFVNGNKCIKMRIRLQLFIGQKHSDAWLPKPMTIL
jgi:collagenase-like PrtC family protease